MCAPQGTSTIGNPGSMGGYRKKDLRPKWILMYIGGKEDYTLFAKLIDIDMHLCHIQKK